MIDLTLEEFILWMICVPIVMVGVYTGWRSLRRRASLRQTRRYIVTCRVCGYVYQDRGRGRDSRCPECGRGNERGRSRRLG